MSRWATATRLGAAFMTGVACALWLFPVLAGPAVQQLRLDRDAARARAETLETEVRTLKESLQKRPSGLVVRRITVQIEGPDARVVVEGERRLQTQLTELYAGRPIDDISAFILNRRLQGHLLEIDGVRYQFTVELVIIGPELAVYGVLRAMTSR
ncbi:MAG: hypothetical protein K0R39_2960 [Symbiobacteriaceae bacterium]|jgi:hypothetical protein|nr:hypothetical protein [Symbiobacteriaceae bacterium]